MDYIKNKLFYPILYIIIIGVVAIIKYFHKLTIIPNILELYSIIIPTSASLFGFFLATLSILINTKELENTKDPDETQLIYYVATIFFNVLIILAINFILGFIGYIFHINNLNFVYDLIWVVLLLLLFIFTLLALILFIIYLRRILITRHEEAKKQYYEDIENDQKKFNEVI